MPAKTNITIPLALSYDTGGVLAVTNAAAGQDQRRVNSYYEITRESIGVEPDVILARRPGVTIDAGTYGTTTQVQYVVGRDPATTWDAVPWIFVKDGTSSKVVNSSTSTNILTNGDYTPRFFDTVMFGTTRYGVVQLQNITTPTATPAQKVYYATAIGSWTEITDADFIALSHRGKMEFMDNFAFIADSNNRIFQSGVSDLSAWAATEFIGRTIVQDAPQGLMKVRNHLLFFGERTVETFVTNENNVTGSILERVPYSAQKIGLNSLAGGGSGLVGKTNYYATVADVGYFIGRFGGQPNDASLMSYDGNRFEKVSRPHEDKLLSSTTLYSINPFLFGGKIAIAIQLTLPTATTQRWLMFFPELNDWFEWESTVYSPVSNGEYFAGINPQKLYTFEAAENFRDDGTGFSMITQFRIPFPDVRWHSMASCGVIADTTSDTQNLAVSFSDNDGATWSTERNIDLSQIKKEITGCGGFMQRQVRLTHTGSGEVRLRKYFASVTD